MANHETETSVSSRIRYYIYGLIRKNGDRSVPIPSSYKLAQEFGTTRSIVRYELEKLIASGALVPRHRVGTFTNPYSNYAQHVLLDDHMPLVGVMYGNGDLFTYAATAAKTLAALFSELADANCYIHDLRLPPQSGSVFPKDVAAYEMDGFIWVKPSGMDDSPLDFPDAPACPTVTVGELHPAVSGVSTDPGAAAQELAALCAREGRRKILTVTLNGKHTALLDAFNAAAAPGTEIRAIRGDTVHEVFAEAREFIGRETATECILCDGSFIKAVSPLLREERDGAVKHCRLAALSDFNGDGSFDGVIVQTPFDELARCAVGLLKEQITGNNRTVKHRTVSLRLRAYP